jgi:hypothetical protein
MLDNVEQNKNYVTLHTRKSRGFINPWPEMPGCVWIVCKHKSKKELPVYLYVLVL